MSKIKRLLIKIIYAVFRLLPISAKKVLLFSYYGEQYSGSPKYISTLLANKSDVKTVWAFTNKHRHAEFSGKSVHYSGLKYYYHLATSGTIITNYRMTEEFIKRKGQKYIQTWHSSLRLKMIENDAINTLPENYIRMAKNDSKQIDFLLAGSKKSRQIFENSFWYNGEIVETGTPQCDILLSDRTAVLSKVKKRFGIPKNFNIAMYAPTFRKDHNTDIYNIEPEQVLTALRSRFGGDWCILIRLHPHLINKLNCFNYTDKIIQATDYDDVQELLCATDFLISDYSAIMFDFAVTKRPCVLYTPDLENYTNKDRNLYFDINELPFKHYESPNSLCKGIESFSADKYSAEMNSFLESIGSFDDGHASERVYEIIVR